VAKEACCPSCGYRAQYWLGYACPRCGAHHGRLYRAEHADPQRAKAMSDEQIAAEYRDAGQAPVAATMQAVGKGVRR
jgi:predicted ATP-dependent serine protease